MTSADRPVVVMAFSDPRSDLKNLRAEENAVHEVFWKVGEFIEIRQAEPPTLDSIVRTIQNVNKRVTAFHYGGHANAFELLLETSDGDSHGAGAGGLAEFLGRQGRFGLQFVFLNGCSTRGQVDRLLDAGVKCVIATERDINDAVATQFAKFFYNALANDKTIGQAFEEASAATKSASGDNTRALYGKRKRKSEKEPAAPWKIHTNDESSLEWTFQFESRRFRRNIVGRDPNETRSLRKLDDLADKIQNDWVDGLLRKSDHNRLDIQLEMEPCPSSVVSRTDDVRLSGFISDENDSPSPRYAAAGDSILDIYDQTDGSLLILGKPGGGKTTVLLELCDQLLRRYRSEIQQPVPVVLQLSSWTSKEVSFRNWVVNELSGKHYASEGQVEQWLDQGRLILLVDGLDEVVDRLRQTCVESYHRFAEQDGAAGVVFCCRIGEYEALENRLRLSGAIRINPLSLAAIIERLRTGSSEDARLCSILDRHEPMRELIQSPLMFWVMRLAFADNKNVDPSLDATEHSQQFESADGCRDYVFDRYLQKMLADVDRAHSKGVAPFDSGSTLRWLSHLARHSDEGRAAIIQVEDIQPGDLKGRFSKIAYRAGLAVAFGLISAVTTSLFLLSFSPLSNDIHGALENGLLFWLAPTYILWMGATTFIDPRLWTPPLAERNIKTLSVTTVTKSSVYFLAWIIASIPALIYCSTLEDGQKPFFLLLGMSGMMGSVLLGCYGCKRNVLGEIESVEAIEFSPSAARWGALYGVVGMLIIWCLHGFWNKVNLHFWFQNADDPSTGRLIYLIVLVVIGAALGAIAGGFEPTSVKGKTRVNQGMRLSISNGLRSGIAGALITFAILVGSTLMILERTLSDGLPLSAASALLTFYCLSMWFGGFELLKHVIVRVVMACTGQMPLNVAQFLAHAAKYRFLRRVGGGYLFLHRLLREHIEAIGIADATREQSPKERT